jgi:hypothetical protein
MIHPASAKIQNIMKQTGGYCCPHFELQRVKANSSKSCCPGRGEELAPVCGLTNTLCIGLAQCPRLDLKTKSELIKKWTEDLARGAQPNPMQFIKG